MAAQSSSYKTEKFNTITSSSTLVQHSLAIPTDSISILKSRFYLDEIFQAQTASGTAFIGGCIVGTNNYNHHNVNRIGSLRSKNATGDVVYFTDSGLNTFGNISIDIIRTTFANQLKFDFTALSAYFFNTTEYGFEYKMNSSSTWLRVVMGYSINAQISLVSTFKAYTGLTPDNLANIRAYIINNEGTYTCPQQSFFTEENIVVVECISRGTNYTCNRAADTNIIIYLRESSYNQLDSLTTDGVVSNIYGYNDDELTTNLPSGWYAAVDGNSNKLYEVSFGMFQRYLTCVPPAPAKTFRLTATQNIDNDGFDIFILKNVTPNFTQDVTISGYIGEGNSITRTYFSITVLADNSAAGGSVFTNTYVSDTIYEFQSLIADPSSIDGVTINFETQVEYNS